MKRKFFKIMGLVLIASIVMIAVVACNKPRDDQKTPPSSTEIVAKLPDMVDYGQAAYINVPVQNYSAADRDAWIADLGEKQDEERGYWLLADENETWDNGEYYSFAAIVDGERQHSYGYLAKDDSGASYWEDSASANTVERIFCYSTPAAVIDKLAAAGIDREHTNLMVEYISREDADREDYHGFTFEIGTSSAIDDYAQLEELEEMYNDWTDAEIAAKSEFANSEEVSDAINLKNRKIYGEIFKIFGSEVDDFARTAIAMGEYAVEVIETVMMEAYKEHIDASKLIISDEGEYPLYGRDYEEFVVYMRNEMYDYDSLSYLIAFREFTEMNADYESGDKTSAMTLFGYHYQFKQRDYNVFDDSVTVEFRGETLTEYEYFLKLSHESYFEDEADALAYRDMDRRQYAEAYRYTTNCLTAYYQSQLEFQAIQEDVDAEIYVGGRVDSNGDPRFYQGISYFGQSTGTGKGSNTITYSSEMQKGLSVGLDATLKIGDVNYEYSGSDDNTLRMNLVSRQWNGLTDEQQQNPSAEQRYYKVEYEIELLNSQNYVLTHTTISDDDLTAALRYEIRSYSADSVRGIQQNKKNEVIYNIDIARMIEALDIGTNDSTGEYVMTPEQAEAYASLIETEGRGYAEYQNLIDNYDSIESEITSAGNANWDGVRSNIATTLEQDYKNYTPVNNIQVDKYFEDTLIRKVYSCGGTLEACANNNGHINCTEEYDTNWALSKLLNEHEKPLRYMYGQIEAILGKLNWVQFSTYNGTPIEGEFFNANLGESNYNINPDSDAITVATLMTDEEIGTVLYNYNGENGAINFQSPKNVPSYAEQEGSYGLGKDVQWEDFTITTINGTFRFVFEGWFVDEFLQYEVLYEEEYNYDIRLYPAYSVEKIA